MNLKQLIGWCLLASCLTLTACQASQSGPTSDVGRDSLELIYTVESVRPSFNKERPPGLVVEADGTASTPGWSDAQLRLRSEKPVNGIFELDFVARRPEGTVSAGPTVPIGARPYVFENWPSDARGVRVNAKSVSIERLVGGGAQPLVVRAAGPNGGSVQVEIVGTIKANVVAIGGETTGTTIHALEQTWELELGTNEEWRKMIEQLDGRQGVVKGSLQITEGVEDPRRRRFIVQVKDLKMLTQ